MVPTLWRFLQRTSLRNLAVNKTLRTHPEFSGDYFVCRTPPWLAEMSSGISLLIAGLLGYVAASADSIAWHLRQILYIAAGLLVLLPLSRRRMDSSIHFVCDHDGIYFPSTRPPSAFSREKESRWLHVPWKNVSDIKTQLFLDETANTTGVVFSVVATEHERHEFLFRHSTAGHAGSPKHEQANSYLLGFSEICYPHNEIVSKLRYFQTSSPSAMR
jgi:hypothetical protein